MKRLTIDDTTVGGTTIGGATTDGMTDGEATAGGTASGVDAKPYRKNAHPHHSWVYLSKVSIVSASVNIVNLNHEAV